MAIFISEYCAFYFIKQKDNVLSLDTYVSVSWFDNKFTWNPASYEDIDVVRIPPKYFWKPDILLTTK